MKSKHIYYSIICSQELQKFRFFPHNKCPIIATPDALHSSGSSSAKLHIIITSTFAFHSVTDTTHMGNKIHQCFGNSTDYSNHSSCIAFLSLAFNCPSETNAVIWGIELKHLQGVSYTNAHKLRKMKVSDRGNFFYYMWANFSTSGKTSRYQFGGGG